MIDYKPILPDKRYIYPILHLRKSMSKPERENEQKLCAHNNAQKDCTTCNENIIRCTSCKSNNVNVQQTFHIGYMRTISWLECKSCHHKWGYN